MSEVVVRPTKLSDLSWLLDVKETGQPLTELSPIRVQKNTVHSGQHYATPTCHMYCEFGFILKGAGLFFVEREEAETQPGDVFLGEPGVPHCGKTLKYPSAHIVIYFLPSVLIEMGPESEGSRVLHRFTGSHSLKERLVRPPPGLRRRLKSGFEEILNEFEKKDFGREIRLRNLLTELLVELMRWEQREGRRTGTIETEADWKHINKILHYLREHSTEPIYSQALAQAVGLGEWRVNALFQGALGMSWVKYLQSYRIHRAAALLSEPGSNVTETAFAVGFESLSHFNAIFRSLMGVSPSEYANISVQKKAD
ncbi:MAG: helix-turn-helix transcriptional regulator [Verrucomicrobia bacterium]|nr:helix-turn-helix transcriptional regulator [Verrucomicrobiota bacterium]